MGGDCGGGSGSGWGGEWVVVVGVVGEVSGWWLFCFFEFFLY